LISINGKITPPEEAMVSVFDRGFLYGDSIYEVTMTINKKPFLIDKHLDRLWNSASKIDLRPDYTKEEIKAEIQKLLEKLDIANVYIRIVLTRGEGEITLDPTIKLKNNLVIIAKDLPSNPEWWYKDGVSMIISHTLRNPSDSLDPNIKSGNYLNNVMAFSEAKKRGAFDAIMLNHHRHVCEATTSNLWIVKNNKVITPPLSAGLLEGITRSTLLEVAKSHGFETYEDNITTDELISADECFITSSTKFIVPVTKIDDSLISDGKPGAITLKLLELYHNFAGSGSLS
jgi:branched-chain amino acid aminotransferase